MFDQADKLRQLVRETIKETAVLEPGLPLVAVSGARAGVGTSAVSLRLAQELTQLGKRVLLVDANLLHPTLASSCEVDAHAGIAEVLCGARSAAEVIEPVAERLLLLPAGSTAATQMDLNITALRRLLTDIRTLHNTADIAVVDCGFGMSPWVERMWIAALEILLVSTADAASIRDAYAAVKLAPWSDVDGKLRLVVNQCDEPKLAARIGESFGGTCRQFLNMKLVGTVSQLAPTASSNYRASARLLAADVLSRSCAYSLRLPRTAGSDAAGSQAAALLSRVGH